jgi:MFS family permease
MQEAGFNTSESMAILAAIPIAGVNFLGAIFAMRVVDNLGRRGVLLWSLPIMVFFLVALAVGFSLLNFTAYTTAGQWVALLCVILYVASFGVGMGPVPWVVNAEIYPLHLRGIANSLSTTANWISNFAVSMTFLTLTSTPVGQVVAWLILAMFAAGTIAWVYFLLPETMGKKLEDVILLFEGPTTTSRLTDETE